MENYNNFDDMFDDMFYEFNKIYDFLKDDDGYKYELPIVYYDIAKELFDNIEKYLGENPEYEKDFVIHQIKTKFSWVCIYYEPSNKDIDGFVKKLSAAADDFGIKDKGALLIWKKQIWDNNV